MKRHLLLATLLLSALLPACGEDGALLRGSLRPDQIEELEDDSLFAWVEGRERVPVREGSFEIADVPAAGTLLAFGSGEDTLARMDLRRLPEGGEVTLEGIRLERESGVAFPTVVRAGGDGPILVNGLRRAAPENLPATVAVDGVVLAAAKSGEAFLLRPADPALPDLRVVATPITEATTADGDPVALSVLESGDSVRVEGGTESGYVVARRVVLSRSLAVREAGGDDGDGRGGEESVARRAASASPGPAPARSAVRAPRGDGDRGRDRGREKEKEKEREKGGGKGKGKGKN